MKARSYQITSFNLEDQEVIKNFENVKYCVIGKETCPTTDRWHIHACVVFANPRAFSALKRALPGAHIEICKGSASRNREYCTKGELIYESGSIPRQGERSDLEVLHALAKAGEPFSKAVEIMESQAFRHEKLWARMVSYYRPTVVGKKEIRIYWGETGTGKTRAVHTEFGDDLYVAVGLDWFNGFDGQRTVIFDDFTGDINESTMAFLLRITDRYPMDVPFKGGFVNWSPERIVFTSNVDPSDWFSRIRRVHVRSFFRRVDYIKEFKNGPLNEFMED